MARQEILTPSVRGDTKDIAEEDYKEHSGEEGALSRCRISGLSQLRVPELPGA